MISKIKRPFWKWGGYNQSDEGEDEVLMYKEFFVVPGTEEYLNLYAANNLMATHLPGADEASKMAGFYVSSDYLQLGGLSGRNLILLDESVLGVVSDSDLVNSD